MLLASALGFTRQDAKTTDDFFTGFPSYWNIVALYVLAADIGQEVTAIVVAALSVMVLVPIRFVYPSRTKTWQALTVTGCALWGVQVLLMIWWMPDVPGWLLWTSWLYPAYYVGLSLVLSVRRQGVTAPPLEGGGAKAAGRKNERAPAISRRLIGWQLTALATHALAMRLSISCSAASICVRRTGCVVARAAAPVRCAPTAATPPPGAFRGRRRNSCRGAAFRALAHPFVPGGVIQHLPVLLLHHSCRRSSSCAGPNGQLSSRNPVV